MSIQLCRWLGMAFVAGGFVGIGVGWNEMARVTCVDCQLPYLLSAGAGGLGAIVLGVGLLIVAQIRAERVRLLSRWEPADANDDRDGKDGKDAPHARHGRKGEGVEDPSATASDLSRGTTGVTVGGRRRSGGP